MYRILCYRILLHITMKEMNVLPKVEVLLYIIKTIRRLIIMIALRIDRIKKEGRQYISVYVYLQLAVRIVSNSNIDLSVCYDNKRAKTESM